MRKTEKVFLAIAFKICNLTEPENFPKSFKFELGWKKVRRICRFILLPFILFILPIPVISRFWSFLSERNNFNIRNYREEFQFSKKRWTNFYRHKNIHLLKIEAILSLSLSFVFLLLFILFLLRFSVKTNWKSSFLQLAL